MTHIDDVHVSASWDNFKRCKTKRVQGATISVLTILNENDVTFELRGFKDIMSRQSCQPNKTCVYFSQYDGEESPLKGQSIQEFLTYFKKRE